MRTAVLALGALACLGAPAQAEIASYYGKELAGRRTASGERFNPSAMTAAHQDAALRNAGSSYELPQWQVRGSSHQ